MANEHDPKEMHQHAAHGSATDATNAPPSYGDSGAAARNAPRPETARPVASATDAPMPRLKQRRGFAAMDPSKQKMIASKGGKASHEQGTGHEWDSAKAREAGRKGGQASRGGRGKLPSESAASVPTDVATTSKPTT